MNVIYLDTNILVASYAVDDAENEKKTLAERAFAVFQQLADVELCTSMWTVTEMFNTLLREKKMERGTVAEIASTLQRKKRLWNLKINFVEVSPQKNYNFDDFFVDVGEAKHAYRSHLADAIHIVIMRNNGITQILTFDGKWEVPSLTVLHPKDIKMPERP
jgi:predicted nucleic acid-binding protein